MTSSDGNEQSAVLARTAAPVFFMIAGLELDFTSWDLSFLFQLQWSSHPELSGGGGGKAGGSWGGGAGGEGEQASSIRGGRSTHSVEEEVSIYKRTIHQLNEVVDNMMRGDIHIL